MVSPDSAASAQAIARPAAISLAPEAPVAEAAVHALALGLAGLRFYEPAAIAGEVEGIHQLRVALRRLRAAVELFAPILHGSRLEFYRRELPLIGHCAGAVRDADVLRELIAAHAKALDPALSRALIPAYQALADTRIAALRDLNRLLSAKHYARVIARLAPTLTRKFTPETTLLRRAPQLMRSLSRSCLRSGAQLTAESPPLMFHRVRVRLKRLRYALEMLDQMAGKRTSKTLKRLRRMQDELGEHQDLVNTALWLRQFARGQLPPETLLATGALLQFVGERRVKVADRAARRWRKFVRGGFLIKAGNELTELARAHANPPSAVEEPL
jgi:CHAD domain-containing protein